MPPESKSGAPPSIYSNMAKMAMSPKAAPPTGGDASGGAGGMEEKKQIVTTLTSVLKKWEELEKDPKGKEIIQRMADEVKKYQTEVLKEAAQAGETGKPPAEAPPPPGGDAGSSAGGGAGAGEGKPPMAA